ncbi:hypothetical protein JCM15457_253 [Liquorilactobacillus sucicola DSM 21376 = JCM 15457]|uniref:VTC domain-containing protein n=1 Tax=Liquorilactobacillus sucicola DSM 21376 = JCM 15457 TaxID=1423806 RepID=A0A023CUB2_9LACO|nr:polyphosphate polymerase domain-containing protein [Liquorilactobacillus sucicola]KRN05323.1 hypothetical protein FD15_GL001874 [Liquorilactobacillus sucicola DSM 21376 = JCM 15457]GAJ25389.1 hypothetical protein JCM15457_253 [Liquorilactobacillus sucicola DSM 21376 = JCM 15457]
MTTSNALPKSRAFQATFKRVEQKYLLTPFQYQLLKEKLRPTLQVDQYGSQTIRSIYYDTQDYFFARKQLTKQSFREKLRLRTYGQTTLTSPAYLELKKKLSGITYKRRISSSKLSALSYMEQQQHLPQFCQNQSGFSEITTFVDHWPLVNQTEISYERTACYGVLDHSIRVTFDENIRWQKVTAAKQQHLLLEPGTVVMEIKVLQAIPYSWSKIFSELGLRPRPFSKYGMAYKYGLLKEEFQYAH